MYTKRPGKYYRGNGGWCPNCWRVKQTNNKQIKSNQKTRLVAISHC